MVVLMSLFLLGRASVGAFSGPKNAGQATVDPRGSSVDGEKYETKLARLWDDIIILNQGILDKVSSAEPGHLQELAAMSRSKREELQRLRGRLEGLTCPSDLVDYRENL